MAGNDSPPTILRSLSGDLGFPHCLAFPHLPRRMFQSATERLQMAAPVMTMAQASQRAGPGMTRR